MWLNSSDIELVSDFESPSTGVQKVGLRFTGLNIPVGATITNAYLVFRAIPADPGMTNSDVTNLTLKGQLTGNASTFTTTSGNISSRTLTSASTAWTPSSWTTGQDYSSPNVSSVIQEIVNQGTWASGNALAIVITGTGHRASQAYDSDPSNAAQLVVTYTTALTNAAPVLDASKSPELTAQNEDSGAPSGAVGTLISSLVDFATPAGQVDNLTDADSGALLGIAVTAANTTNGTLWYSTNNGSSWNALGAVSNASARLLVADANTRIYFEPNANYNGTISDAITFRAWDQTSGTNGSLADTSTNGGVTAFSTATDTASLVVNAANDAPVLADTTLSITVAEDAGVPSGAVGSLISAFTGGISDVDSGAVKGIAIAASVETNGTWYYTTNAGTNWTAVGTVSSTSSLLLADNANTRLYFGPGSNYNGTSTSALTVRGWDQTSGTVATKVDTSANGTTTAFSSASDVVDVTVSSVNDAPSFAVGNGRNYLNLSGLQFGNAVAQQADGKYILAGWSDGAGTRDFAVARYNNNGTLDTTFGSGNGYVITAIGASDEEAQDVRVLSSGKILVVGYASNGGNSDIAMVQYNSDGTLDTSFGSGTGKVLSGIGGGDTGYSLAIQSDGKILVSGDYGNDFLLARFTSAGVLDTSFGSSGTVSTDFNGGSDKANSMVVQADGKIILAGQAYSGTTFQDFAVARYNSDGTLDTTFNGTGKQTIDIGTNSSEQAFGVAVGSDGKIVVTGFTGANGTTDNAVVRLNANGSLDTSFGGTGKIITAIGSGSDFAQDVKIQADGKVLTSGYFSGSGNDFSVVRYNVDGTLDTTFGGTGKVALNFNATTDDRGARMLLQADGQIVIAGCTTQGGTYDLALARITSSGTLDLTFNPSNTLGGTISYTENGTAVVLDSDVQIFDSELSTANNFSGATLTLARNGGANSQDLFSASGTLMLSAGNVIVSGTTIGTFTNSAGTLVLTFNSSATQALVNSAMRGIAYSNSSDAPPSSAIVNWTFSDGNTGSQGTGGALTAMGSVTINITAVNDAPILTAYAPVYNTTEDAALFSASVATLLSSSVTDPDGSGVQGIAVYSVSGSGGTLEYSVNGGSTWLSVGTVSSSSALLLRSTDQIRFSPSTTNGGTMNLDYRGWDQTTGTVGNKVDVSSNGGTTAFSASTDRVAINTTSVNDAPTITNGASVALTSTNEKVTSSGTLSSAILTSSSLADVDTGAASGLAITATTGSGTWQYSTDGVTWRNFGSVTSTSALLVTSSTQLRYMPAINTVETATFSYKAWDQTSGSASTNGAASYATTASVGGTTAFSTSNAMASITVNAVNDAPVQVNSGSNFGGVYSYNDVSGNWFVQNTGFNTGTIQGQTAGSVINLSSSAGGSSTSGVIVYFDGSLKLGGLNGGSFANTGSTLTMNVYLDTGNDGQFFSFTGNQFTGLAGDSYGSATLAATGGSFDDNTAFTKSGGIGALTSTFTLGQLKAGAVTGIDAQTRVAFWIGGGNSFSSTISNISLAASTTNNLTVMEDSGLTALGLGSLSFGPGGGADEAGQTLSYTVNAVPSSVLGNVVLADGSTVVTASTSYTLTQLQGMQFQTAVNSNGGPATFTYTVQDNGGTLNGGVDSISRSLVLSVTAVNDAAELADTALSITVAEDAGVPTGVVGSLISSFTGGISDVDAGAVKGIAITNSNETNGVWYYTTNNGTTWTAVGTVSSASSLLLADNANTRLYFAPGSNYNGTSTSALTVRGWDQTSGTVATKVDTSTNGTTTAFSSATDVIDAVVSAVNDAPVISTSGAAVAYTENSSPTIVASAFTATDIDSANFNTGTLTASCSSGGTPNDQLIITPGGNVTVVGSAINYSGTQVATYSGGTNGSALVITFNSSSSPTIAQDIGRQIAYFNISDNPSTTARTLDFVLTDGAGGTSNTAQKTINVTAVADSPIAVEDRYGLRFDGVDDYVNLGSSASLAVTSALTVEMWVRPTAYPASSSIILNKEGEYELGINSTGMLRWAITNTNPGWNWHDTGYTLALNQWAHVSVTYNAGVVNTYVNGTLVETYYGSGTIGDAYPALNDLRIGGRQNNPAGQYFAGDVDDVRVWNVVRTQSQIQTNLAASLVGNESGLVGYWRFNEGTGTTTTDLTANANTGTLVDGGAGTAGPQWTGYSTSQNSSLSIFAASGVLSNDLDGESNTLTVTQVNGSGANVGSAFTLPSGATLTLTSTGAFNYNPNGAYHYLSFGQTATDSYTYQVSDGTGNFSTATAFVTVIGVNDAPTLGNGTLAAVLEDATNPAGATTSSIFTGQFSDVDSGSSFGGIAVVGNTANSLTQGTWEYSTDGTNWYAIGTVADGATALALNTSSLLRFVPVGNYNGTPTALVSRGLDNTYGAGFTSGASRVNVDTTSNGGTTSISGTTANVNTSNTPVNDAPTIASGYTYNLTGTNEDTSSSGTLASAILTSSTWADVDTSAVSGLAITSKTGNGTWQYSTDGTTWNAFGAVTSTNALLITSTTQVRYIPDAANGETATFTYKAWDQTSGTASTNGTANYATTASSGSTTAFSSITDAAQIVVTSMNDAPVLDNAGNMTLTTRTEDQTTNTGDTVASIVLSAGGDRITDVDTSAVEGIAITATTNGTGTWQYSTDGGSTWTAVGTVTNTSALLLRATDSLRFVPNGQNATTGDVTFRA